MDLTHFYKGMSSLKQWFNRRLTDSQMDQWATKFDWMPTPAFDDIIELIKDEEKAFPSPAVFKQYFGKWKDDNPEFFRKEHDQVDCPDCDGKGYIVAWHQAKDLSGFVVDGERVELWNRVDLACNCPNWKNAFPTRGNDKPKKYWSRAAIAANGMRLDDPYEPYGKEDKKYANVNEMADDVGQGF